MKKSILKKYIPIAAAFPLLLSLCSEKANKNPYHLIPRAWVYSIQQHNDSIYFSTSEDGIFRFHPDRPGAVSRVAWCRRVPIRSIVFKDDGKLYASSYYTGVYYAEKDTLLPVRHAQYPAWSMKQDEKGVLWLAGTWGVFREKNDSLILFTDLRDAHDIAFLDGEVAVAHMRGISIYDRERGKLKGEFCKGVIFWTITRYDSLLIAGGLNVCAIINRDSCREIHFGPDGNMAWAIQKDSSGSLYLGTQKGLFRAEPAGNSAECVGMAGICVKSLLIDKKGRLWAGRFYK